VHIETGPIPNLDVELNREIKAKNPVISPHFSFKRKIIGKL